MQPLIAIRTHVINADLLRLATVLADDGQYEIIFAVDERSGVLDTDGFGKASITDGWCAQHGLYAEDPHYTWKFGDYFFYAARKTRPNAPYIWLLEFDVLLNSACPTDIIKDFDNRNNSDLLATFVEEAPQNWVWRVGVEQRYKSVWRCYFPLVRLSAQAVDHLLTLRQMQAPDYAKYGRTPTKMIPNDEAHVACGLVNAGFSVTDINSLGNYYSAKTFQMNILYDRAQLNRLDGKIYHAVLAGEAYERKRRKLFG